MLDLQGEWLCSLLTSCRVIAICLIHVKKIYPLFEPAQKHTPLFSECRDISLWFTPHINIPFCLPHIEIYLLVYSAHKHSICSPHIEIYLVVYSAHKHTLLFTLCRDLFCAIACFKRNQHHQISEGDSVQGTTFCENQVVDTTFLFYDPYDITIVCFVCFINSDNYTVE